MGTVWDKYYKRPAEEIPWLSTPFSWLESQIKLGSFFGKRILDVGCGIGDKSFFLAQQLGAEVIGVDISQIAISTALAASKNHPDLSCEFFCHDVCDDDFMRGLGMFDAIVDWACIHTLPEDHMPNYVGTIERLLSPSGLLVVRTFSAPVTDSMIEHIDSDTSVELLRFSHEDILNFFPNMKELGYNMSEPMTKSDTRFLEVLLKKI